MSAIHGIYYKTDDGNIYKYNQEKDYFLLCTPWKIGEDRRKKKSELLNPVKYNKHKAVYEINEIWRNTTFKWEHNGKKYETRGQIYDEKLVTTKKVKYNWCNRYFEYNHIDYTKLFELCPEHKWHHTSDWTDRNGVHHHREYDDSYYLCMYQGKLVWVCRSQYIPQVYYYSFIDIDLEPGKDTENKKHRFGWTNINCLRPVYCITDKKFI